MIRRAFAITLILILFDACQGRERGGVSSEMAIPVVMGVLGKAGVSGSLEYWGRCNLDRLPDFPKVHVPGRNTNSPVQALREGFSGDPEMRVTQEPDGTIRMSETDIPRDLLDLRIDHILFKMNYGSRGALYNPRDALLAILDTPEVAAFVAAHDIEFSDFEQVHGEMQMPSPKQPYISGELHNVTLSQALDYVLRTFPGIWIYENCPSKRGKRVVIIKFF